MNITTSSFRRIAAVAGATTITCISAITTTYATQPASATTESQPPQPERQCFIIQPRWNTAIDGPAPTCPTPSWQSAGSSGADTRSRIEFGDEYDTARR